MASIQFSTMLAQTPSNVLTEIKSLKDLGKLTIQDCAGLNDKLLRELIEGLSRFEILGLVRCFQTARVAAHLREKKTVINIKDGPINKKKLNE